MFLKAPARILVFKTEAPNISLPPDPILLRCGTWLMAAPYYYKYYKDILTSITKYKFYIHSNLDLYRNILRNLKYKACHYLAHYLQLNMSKIN